MAEKSSRHQEILVPEGPPGEEEVFLLWESKNNISTVGSGAPSFQANYYLPGAVKTARSPVSGGWVRVGTGGAIGYGD